MSLFFISLIFIEDLLTIPHYTDLILHIKTSDNKEQKLKQ